MDRDTSRFMMPRLLFILLTFFAFESLADTSNSPPTNTANEEPPAVVAEKVDRDDSQILQRHYPFYFAYGRPLSKLQLSFKTPMVRGYNTYFAYSQVMFWALEEDSKPFRDQTYNPELFHRFELKKWGALKSLDVSPWSHNSNGKRGVDSRSYNRMYLRANLEHEYSRWMVRTSVQVSNLYGKELNNGNIPDYVGPLSFSISFVQLFDSWVDKSEFTLLASPGGEYANHWDRGGYQASLSFRFGGINIVPAFYLQYYSGYAETLLNYDKDVQQFRAGVIF